MKWTSGRQSGNYLKMPLVVSKYFKFDIYLLKFLEQSHIVKHVDQSPNSEFEHHRLNIILKKPAQGGAIHIDGAHTKFGFGRVTYFRPDLHPHWMDPVVKGEYLILSIGWLR